MDVQDGVSDRIMNGDIEADEEADGLAELSKDLASRPIHKAKRLLGRRSPGKETVGQSDRHIRRTTPPTQAKNSKKSRDGRGRGLPKKGKHVVFCFGELWWKGSRSFAICQH